VLGALVVGALVVGALVVGVAVVGVAVVGVAVVGVAVVGAAVVCAGSVVAALKAGEVVNRARVPPSPPFAVGAGSFEKMLTAITAQTISAAQMIRIFVSLSFMLKILAGPREKRRRLLISAGCHSIIKTYEA